MIVLKNWTAKRAGGRITLTGVAHDGLTLKVVGVDTITGSARGIIATHKSGQNYQLT